MSHHSHFPDNLKFYSYLFSPYQSYIPRQDNGKLLNTSVTLRIPSILETLPKAELPASVKLHMCKDKAKPDSDEESCTSPAYHFGTDMFAQAVLRGITMSVHTENTIAPTSKPTNGQNPTTFLSPLTTHTCISLL